MTTRGRSSASVSVSVCGSVIVLVFQGMIAMKPFYRIEGRLCIIEVRHFDDLWEDVGRANGTALIPIEERRK